MRPIYDESQRLVPVLTRALRLSGNMQVTASPTGSGRRVVEVGYAPRGNPEYAITVHEQTQYLHEPPTQAKFLEQAIQNNARRSIERIRDYLADPRTVPNPKSLQVMPRYIPKNDLKTERGRRMRAERMAEGLDRPLEDIMSRDPARAQSTNLLEDVDSAGTLQYKQRKRTSKYTVDVPGQGKVRIKRVSRNFGARQLEAGQSRTLIDRMALRGRNAIPVAPQLVP